MKQYTLNIHDGGHYGIVGFLNLTEAESAVDALHSTALVFGLRGRVGVRNSWVKLNRPLYVRAYPLPLQPGEEYAEALVTIWDDGNGHGGDVTFNRPPRALVFK